MLILVGLFIGMASIFGGFALAGGKFGPIWQPTEVLMIVGAGVGAYVMGNSSKVLKATVMVFSKLSATKHYKKSLYMELLGLMSRLLTRLRTNGVKAVEKDVENPTESDLFKEYPLIMKDEIAMNFLLDYMRLVLTGTGTPLEMDELMTHEIEIIEAELMEPAEALQKVGDAFPAFGIVAAVMGVVKALSSADEGAEKMGQSIAHALVGTFLGVLISYGIVNPLASRISGQVQETIKTLQCIRVTMLAYLNQIPPKLAVEFGRKALYMEDRPNFDELEQYLEAIEE